jgi:hypothetical protein
MTDSPDIEFVYDDADTYQNEMWDQNYQDERVGIPLTSLTLSHLFGCPQPGPGKTNIGNHCYSIVHFFMSI